MEEKTEQGLTKETKEFLWKADALYLRGDWQDAVRTLEDRILRPFAFEGEAFAEAKRIIGSYYYLAIKGPEDRKIENLLKAKAAFKASLEITTDNETKLSVTNMLPLTLWILGEKEEAWKISDDATKEFSSIPSAWNTQSILLRWAGEHRRSVDVCQKVYETAVKTGSFRTAGHGKQNKSDALVKLGRKEEAKDEYGKAIELYKKYEKVSGKSAQFHIDGAQKKLADLS